MFAKAISCINELKEYSTSLDKLYKKDLTRIHGIVYAIGFDDGVVKVGKTQDPLNRFCSIANSSGRNPNVVFSCLTDNYSQVENKVLKSLSKFNTVSEFFECDFSLIPPLIKSFSTEVSDDVIGKRNSNYNDKSGSLVDSILSLNPDNHHSNYDNLKTLSNNMIANRMFYAYNFVDYSDVTEILGLEMSIEDLNVFLVVKGLFDSVGVVSDFSMDEKLMRSITSEWVDFDFIMWKCSSIIVSQKGMDFIRKLLKKELVK